MKLAGIAVSGKAASGKSGFADLLELELQRRGEKVVRLAFGDALKAAVGPEKINGGRRKLVDEGKRRRTEDPFWFVRTIGRDLAGARNRGRVVIIDDVRLRREERWLRDVGFYFIRVDTSSLVRMKRLAERGEDPLFAETSETSEVELDYAAFDYRVQGDQPIGLRFYAKEAVDRFLAARARA